MNTGSIKRILSLVLVSTGALSAHAANTPTIANQTASGIVGVAFFYQVVASTPDQFPITSYGTTVSVPGVSFSTTTGQFSGTPTTPGTYPGNISATNSKGTSSATMTITIVAPNFIGFRLPDFQMSAGSSSPPLLTLQMGANGTSTTANRFNATLEINVPGTTTWIPYNHFVGISDPASWISNAPLPVRNSGDLTGTPQAFSPAQLTVSPPAVYMKSDPRSTRFGVFQMDTNPTGKSRIIDSLWPSGSAALPNGYGGSVGSIAEHVPLRFNGSAYYPATFAINGPADARDTGTTTYADNDGVTRPADAIYLDAATTTGQSTPYGTDAKSALYHPIILNRPFRNVAELGYAFRDLPWKTLDFFNQNSADAGLLDIFCINDGTQVLDGQGNIVGMAPPTMVAGQINLNTQQAPVLQAVLAGALLDDTSTTVSNIGSPTAQNAQTMATNITAASLAIPFQNKTETITRVDPTTSVSLATQILPVTSSQDNQTIKARREVVPRAVSSVSQTRVWNVLIDVVAQSGRYPPGETDPKKFIVEGEQHYWVHVAIDRFTGQVIDKQIEVVQE